MEPISKAIRKQEEIALREINEIKEAAEDTRREINHVRTKTAQFWTMTNFQKIIFWIAVACNIGIAGYLLSTLIGA